jgi:hypothetical protein
VSQEQPDYQAYLLRLWRVNGAGKNPVWRASIQSSLAGRERNFASLLDLLGFL